ncbi:hypothetical protein [Deinococcus sp. PESE-13]
MRRMFAPLLLAAALLPAAQAQGVYGPPAPPAPVTPTPAAAPTGAPGLALTAPADTLREYRLSETTRVRYDNVQLEVSGGTPETAAAFQNQFRAALRAREGERTLSAKQFLKVLPAEGTPGRYLWNTISNEGGKAASSRSLRTLGTADGGTLAFQPEPVAAGTDPSVAALLAPAQAELAHTHAELLAGLDPASFGLLRGGPAAGSPRPGQGFVRLKTVQPPSPLMSLPGQQVVGAPLQVEQQLRFENEEGGQLVFFRQARVVQPGQILSGSVEGLMTLLRYVYDGELRLTPDGLPVSAERGEAYAVQMTGRLKQGDLSATYSLNVTVTSLLTLTPVK